MRTISDMLEVGSTVGSQHEGLQAWTSLSAIMNAAPFYKTAHDTRWSVKKGRSQNSAGRCKAEGVGRFCDLQQSS